ncbi:MAG: FMN reductase (NADPH) [Alphaproteobacteria bacterium MarineAlpha11_Bin1]|nr:MAG: FMN reductase (NADPH) [Alphaproteobacteria bacterium MarineAlpha11_Bin1]
MKTGVVVGNPKPKSRTFEAANLVAEKLTGAAPDYVLDIADLGAGLLEWGNPDVGAAVETVQALEVVIFASPTYKATYTGLMKLFLDQIPQDGLAGVTALPVMLGAGPAHLLAPDLLFKPVLVELGAICPTAGLYLIDTSFAEDPRLDAWIARTRPALPAGLG